MRRLILIILILTLIFVAGCAEEEISECDAQKPCKEGYQCAKLPDNPGPVCISPDVLKSDEYKDCRIAESYPIQVICPQIRGSSCKSDSDCKVSGCNGEICSGQEMVSICLYKPEFECYKLTNCKCINGRCGWEQTEEFLDCRSRY